MTEPHAVEQPTQRVTGSIQLAEDDFRSRFSQEEHDSVLSITPPASISLSDLRSPVSPLLASSGSESIRDHEQTSSTLGVDTPVESDAVRPLSVDTRPETSQLPILSETKSPKFSSDSPTTRSKWQPFWCRRSVLVCFPILFLAFFTALLSLLIYAIQNDGIAATLSLNHYTWKYGPTAVLTLALLFWRQIEYICKILAPWKQLLNGPSSLESTLHLDYLDPILPKTLWIAFRLRHWVVACGVSVALLLQIAIILSTTLFVQFRGEYNMQGPSAQISDTLVHNSGHFTQGLSSAVMTYFQSLYYGQSLPPGTAGGIAFDNLMEFNFTGFPTDTTAKATVHAVLPVVNCRSVEYNISMIAPINCTSARGFRIYIQDADCPIDRNSPEEETDSLGVVSEYTPEPDVNPTGLMNDRIMDCRNRYIVGDNTNVSSQYRMLSVVKVEYLPIPDSEICDSGPKLYPVILDSAVVVCSIEHYSSDVDIYSSSDLSWHPSSPIDAATVLSRYTGNNSLDGLADAIDTSMQAAYLMLPSIIVDPSTGLSPWPIWILILTFLNTTRWETLLDPRLLAYSSTEFYRNVGAQLANLLMRQHETGTVEAFVTVPTVRLHIRTLTASLMLAIFAIIFALSVIVTVGLQRTDVPCRPDLPMRRAQLLAASPDLLRWPATLTPFSIRKRPAVTKESTTSPVRNAEMIVYQQGFQLCHHEAPILNGYSVTVEPNTGNWSPIAASPFFACFLIVLVSVIIIVLELLQRLSDTKSGFTSVMSSGSSSAASFWASTLSAAITSGVALLLEMSLFATAVLSPYRRLSKNKPTRSSKALFCRFLGQLPVELQIEALNRRQFPVFAISIAAFASSLLTVAVSALFTIQLSGVVQDVEVRRADAFGITGTAFNAAEGRRTDNGTAGIVTSIEIYNLSYPSWTFGELAFPQLDIGNSSEGATSIGRTMNATIPAYRSSLDCKKIPKENMTLFYANKTEGGGNSTNPMPVWSRGVLFTKIGLPSGCHSAGSKYNLSTSYRRYSYMYGILDWAPIRSDPEFDLEYSEDEFGIFMNVTFVHGTEVSMTNENFTTYMGTVNGYSTFLDMTSPEINPPYCPSMINMIGNLVPNNTDLSEVNAYVCSQYVEAVDDVRIKLNVSNNNVLSASYSDSGLQVVAPINVDLEYNVQLSFQAITDYDPIGVKPTVSEPEDLRIQEPMDLWTQSLVYGRHGIPTEELVGNRNRENFLNTTQAFFRRYMAQYLNLNARTTNMTATTNDSESTFFAAELSSFTQLRISQNRLPKMILQILLSITLLGLIVTYSLTWGMHRVLRYNPCSLAGGMSLFLDSTIIQPGRGILPALSEGLSDRELERKLSEYKFHLGLWPVQATQSASTLIRHDHEQVEEVRNSLLEAQSGGDEFARFGIDICLRDTPSRDL